MSSDVSGGLSYGFLLPVVRAFLDDFLELYSTLRGKFTHRLREISSRHHQEFDMPVRSTSETVVRISGGRDGE